VLEGCLYAARSSEVQQHLVVASQLADGSLWAVVLNLGGYDVLAEPFEAAEVNRTLDSALRNWMWLKGNRPDFVAIPKENQGVIDV
jgi:hypothetical protein